MDFLKHGSRIYDVRLNAKEREAADKAIGKMIADANRKNAANFDALVLYVLMEHYGWKKDRLKKFWMAFCKEHKALCDRYELYGVHDNTWLAEKKLAEAGVDIAAWYREMEEEEARND
jgi:hypothetical protein